MERGINNLAQEKKPPKVSPNSKERDKVKRHKKSPFIVSLLFNKSGKWEGKITSYNYIAFATVSFSESRAEEYLNPESREQN